MKLFLSAITLVLIYIVIAYGSTIDVITINNEYPRKIKTPVILNHSEHNIDYGIECIECHHDIGEGKDPRPCLNCHKINSVKILKLKNAYHKNCRDCHKEMGNNTKCSDCHKKEEK